MTPRQSRLLKAIIDEFIQTADAVGSVNLANKYRLGVSPATIRNEMANLVKSGYLQKPHSSSGRVPTNMGFKYFIDKLLRELDDLGIESSNRIREQLFQSRFDKDKLIYKAVNALSNESKALALVLLGNRAYYAGISRLLDQPDFNSRDELIEILKIIEDQALLHKVFEKYRGKRAIRILVGEDTGHGSLANVALIFSPIKLHGDRRGYLALVGPNRMNYARNIPLIEFISANLNEVVSGW
ncbi:MAG: hypothetical protein ACE5DX_00655 [Candidatus Dojkabacteria bacterium]